MLKIEKFIYAIVVLALGILIYLFNSVSVYQTRMESYEYQYYTTKSFYADLISTGQFELTNFEENVDLNYGSPQSPHPPYIMGPWMMWVNPYYHYSNPQKSPENNEYIFITNDVKKIWK